MKKAKERIIVEGEENVELVHQHVARYEFAKAFVCGKRVLDVACGSGYGTSMLKQAGATYVLGVDVSESAVEYARDHYSKDNVNFAVGTAENLSSYEKFDAVISFETIEHLEHPEVFLAEIARVLSPGGILMISTPVREHGTLRDKPKNPYHIREWSRDEFQGLLREYFQVVDVYGQYNFRKWFPYSRTLQRILFRSFLPQHFRDIDHYSVLADPPNHARFRFEMAIVLCICGTT